MKELYGKEKMQGSNGGVASYCMLRWNDLDEQDNKRSRREKEFWKKIQPLYGIAYVQDFGFAYIFGQEQELQKYELNPTKTGMNKVKDYDPETGILPDPYKWIIDKDIRKIPL